MKTNLEINLKTVALFFSAFIIMGCASLSTMQTARTTPKNEFGLGFGGGSVNSKIDIGIDTVSISAPFVEGYGRYGITDKLDIGFKFTIIGTISTDVKYQLIGDQNSIFAGSIGGGLGYMSIVSGDSKSSMYDLIVPTYISLHPIKFISLYCSPKYIFRINSYSNNSSSGVSNNSWYGITSGLRLGKKFGLFLEYSYFKNSNVSTPFTQVTGGLALGIY